MFAYCRNNPVSRVDISGREDMECTDLDGNPTIDEEDIVGGGGNSGGNSTTGSSSSDNGGSGQPSVCQPSPPSPGGGGTVMDGNPNGEVTEIHHIVEQCQATKSGFFRVNIDGARNKVSIPRSVHRKISGYYSSKPADMDGLRVRDWLAGQSWEFQYNFGMQILNQMWMEVFG